MSNQAPAERRRSQRGFTLIEILVVVVILGLLATLVAQNLFGVDDDARLQKVKSDLSTIDQAVERYRIKFGRLPEDLGQLIQNDQDVQFLKADEVPKDPWGNEYRLDRDDKGRPMIASNGPDGSPDSEDDITTKNMTKITIEDLQKLQK